MITDHTLRIRPVANRPRAWEITIDGTDVAGLVTAFTLRATAASLRPTVELELVAYNGLDPDSELTAGDVRIDPEQAELLTRLGWTPPA